MPSRFWTGAHDWTMGHALRCRRLVKNQDVFGFQAVKFHFKMVAFELSIGHPSANIQGAFK